MSKKDNYPTDSSPDSRLARISDLALKEIEKRISEGTAKDTTLQFMIRLDADRKKDELERERLINENKLLIARVEALQAAKDSTEIYQQAIDAMKLYSGRRDYEEVGFDINEDLH